MEEIWKDVVGFEGLYQVSDLGRVKSLHYKMTDQERVLVPVPDRIGYLRVKFKSKVKLVHRLVWETFIGPISPGFEVNHINEDKSDNRLSNLNLLTHKENVNWGSGTERAIQKQSHRIAQYTKSGELVNVYPSINDAARQTGFNMCSIMKCCKGIEYKTVGGFVWRYAEQKQIEKYEGNVKKLLEPKTKHVIGVKDGIEYEFESVRKAAEVVHPENVNAGRHHIHNVIKGYSNYAKTAYGFTWRYAEQV